MGYQVEYLATAPLERVRAWLSDAGVEWLPPSPESDDAPHGRLTRFETAIEVYLAPHACRLRLPGIPYSWLAGRHPMSLEQASLLDAWIAESLPETPAVRLDEFLRMEWEEKTGRAWDACNDPVAEFRAWCAAEPPDPDFYRFLGESS